MNKIEVRIGSSQSLRQIAKGPTGGEGEKGRERGAEVR